MYYGEKRFIFAIFGGSEGGHVGMAIVHVF